MVTYTNIEYKGEDRLTFTINDAELSLVNACRRIILSEIPTVGFYFDPNDIENSDIKIAKNTCSLHNEFLAHRISLVPLCFDENEINDFDPSKYKFILKKENNTLETIDVTTDDFEIVDDSGKKYPQELKNRILPKNNITKSHILLTKLKPNLYDENATPKGESVNIECFPSVGIGMKHARWSPVSQCCYSNTIDKEAAADAFDKILQDHEREAGRQASRSEKESLKRHFDSLQAYRHFKTNKYQEANCFDFKIESECHLRPAYLFVKSLKVLLEKLSKFSDNLVNKREDILKVTKLTGVDNFYQVTVIGENHTLLNVLQSFIHNICFRQRKSSENPLEYIGYYQPHPLDDLMVIKMKFKNNADDTINVAYVNSFLIELTNEISDIVKTYAKTWLDTCYNSLKDVKEVVEFKTTL